MYFLTEPAHMSQPLKRSLHVILINTRHTSLLALGKYPLCYWSTTVGILPWCLSFLLPFFYSRHLYQIHLELQTVFHTGELGGWMIMCVFVKLDVSLNRWLTFFAGPNCSVAAVIHQTSHIFIFQKLCREVWGYFIRILLGESTVWWPEYTFEDY